MTDERITVPMIPVDRPELSLGQARNYATTYKVQEGTFILGIRGFEVPGANHTTVYDDCIALVDPIYFHTFNANTDPTKHGQGMATVIAPQVVQYKIGIHNLHKDVSHQYEALVQAGPIRVTREGIGEVPPGFFGINIHRGGNTSPGSEGCQTIPPIQWDQFINLVADTMKMRKIYTIPYLLVEL